MIPASPNTPTEKNIKRSKLHACVDFMHSEGSLCVVLNTWSCCSLSCRECLSCAMLCSFSCITNCFSASLSFSAASLACSSQRVFWRALRRSCSRDRLQMSPRVFGLICLSPANQPDCVFLWPPGAAELLVNQSWVCPWISEGHLLASGSVWGSSDWPPAPDQERTGSSAGPPARSVAGRGWGRHQPLLNSDHISKWEFSLTFNVHPIIAERHRFWFMMSIKSHLFLRQLVTMDHFLQLTESAVLSFYQLVQLLGLEATQVITTNIQNDLRIRDVFLLHTTHTSLSLVPMVSVRPWMVLSWLWAAWRSERSSHSISFNFSCSFCGMKSRSSGCQRGFDRGMQPSLCGAPCCWPRSPGSWLAGIGPGAGPSAARWHTDQQRTHTGSVDSAALQPGSVMEWRWGGVNLLNFLTKSSSWSACWEPF